MDKVDPCLVWYRQLRCAIGTTPELAQKLQLRSRQNRFPQTLFGFGKSIHVHKVHVCEVYAHEVHAREIHAHEEHACEIHVYTHEICYAQQTGMHRMDGSNCLIVYLSSELILIDTEGPIGQVSFS
jgi:hypothetical protein